MHDRGECVRMSGRSMILSYQHEVTYICGYAAMLSERTAVYPVSSYLTYAQLGSADISLDTSGIWTPFATVRKDNEKERSQSKGDMI